MPKKVEPAVRGRVVRAIAGHRLEYATPTALAKALAARERIGAETVRLWTVQHDIDGRDGTAAVAGERVRDGHATKSWPVVLHDGDRSGCFTDHVVVGVDDVHHAAVGTEVVEVEDPFGLDNGPAEATESILAARRRGDGGGEAVLGGVVDDCAVRQILPQAISNSEKSICQTRFRCRGEYRNTRFRSAPTICGLPGTGRQQKSAPAAGALNGAGSSIESTLGAGHARPCPR